MLKKRFSEDDKAVAQKSAPTHEDYRQLIEVISKGLSIEDKSIKRTIESGNLRAYMKDPRIDRFEETDIRTLKSRVEKTSAMKWLRRNAGFRKLESDFDTLLTGKSEEFTHRSPLAWFDLVFAVAVGLSTYRGYYEGLRDVPLIGRPVKMDALAALRTLKTCRDLGLPLEKHLYETIPGINLPFDWLENLQSAIRATLNEKKPYSGPQKITRTAVQTFFNVATVHFHPVPRRLVQGFAEIVEHESTAVDAVLADWRRAADLTRLNGFR